MKDHIYYASRTGVTVTRGHLRTRHRDQSLSPITSIRIGREPLLLALCIGLGLAAFAWRFGDLLYSAEQLILGALAVLVLGLGYSIVSLDMGSYRHEQRMLWGSHWTVRRIRDAVVAARDDRLDAADVVLTHMGEDGDDDNAG